MKIKWMAVLGLMCGLVSTGFAAEPVVSNVTASQIPGTKLVDIYYDLQDDDGDAMTVTVLIHDRDVQVPASSFTGALGENQYSGTGKHIVWDAGADWNGLYSENIRVGIAASDDGTEPPPSGMVRIPHGTNTGTDPDFGSYFLTLPDDIFMDRTEITLAQWGEVRGWAINNGYSFNVGGGVGLDHPVTGVNRSDCTIWCNAKSEMEGLIPCYTLNSNVVRSGWGGYWTGDENGYRLPTRIEWEYAARGGLQDKRYPWGDTISPSSANYVDNTTYPSTSPVGTFGLNDYGLQDMVGNVREWNNDGAYASYIFTRGGGYNDPSGNLRCGFSNKYDHHNGSGSLGFRTVRKAP